MRAASVAGNQRHLAGVAGEAGWASGGECLLHKPRDGVVARALELLLLDLLLDEVLRVADGGGRARDGDDAVARARREGALLRYLDVSTRHLLDLYKAATAGAWNIKFILSLSTNIIICDKQVIMFRYFLKSLFHLLIHKKGSCRRISEQVIY